VNAPAAEALSALLDRYADPALATDGRLVDVPPLVAARALELLTAGRPLVVFDGIQVDAVAARELAGGRSSQVVAWACGIGSACAELAVILVGGVLLGRAERPR
jgi:hypothetical protein